MAQAPVKDAFWSAEKEKEYRSLKEYSKSLEVTLEQTMKAKQNRESDISKLESINEQLRRDFTEMANKADKITEENAFINKKLNKALEELKLAIRKIEQLQTDLETLRKSANIALNEKQDMQRRCAELSRMMSKREKSLLDGNLNKSDTNIALKVVERFQLVFDEEWTTAENSLTSKQKFKEPISSEQAIQALAEVVKIAYEFCMNYASQQQDVLISLWNHCLRGPFATYVNTLKDTTKVEMPDQVLDAFKAQRRVKNMECIQNAIKEFQGGVLPKIKYCNNPDVQAFASKCIEVLWMMVILDPPMVIEWPVVNAQFNSLHYKEYRKKGTVAKLPVWPAVFLSRNETLMRKGYVLPV